MCRRWREIAQPNTLPRPIPEASPLRKALGEVLDDLKGLMVSFPGRPMGSVTLTMFTDWLPRLASDNVTPFRIVRASELERELQQIDRGRTLAEIRRSKPDPSLWTDVFTYGGCVPVLTRHGDRIRQSRRLVAAVMTTSWRSSGSWIGSDWRLRSIGYGAPMLSE